MCFYWRFNFNLSLSFFLSFSLFVEPRGGHGGDCTSRVLYRQLLGSLGDMAEREREREREKKKKKWRRKKEKKKKKKKRKRKKRRRRRGRGGGRRRRRRRKGRYSQYKCMHSTIIPSQLHDFTSRSFDGISYILFIRVLFFPSSFFFLSLSLSLSLFSPLSISVFPTPLLPLTHSASVFLPPIHHTLSYLLLTSKSK